MINILFLPAFNIYLFLMKKRTTLQYSKKLCIISLIFYFYIDIDIDIDIDIEPAFNIVLILGTVFL